MHLNVGGTSHKIEEEEVVHQKPSEATMGKPPFLSLLYIGYKINAISMIVTDW